MNVRIFFVRHYKEYFRGHEVADTKDLNIAFAEYTKAINDHQEKLNPNLKETREGELYGETGIDGLKIDFNFGLRLDIPEGNFHVKISDYDTETVFFNADVSNVRLISSEGYFIRWHVEVFQNGENVFEHVFDPTEQKIFIIMRSQAMGDNLALLPYVREFQEKYDCELYLWIAPYMRELVKHLYPEIKQVEKISYDYYATFYMLAFMGSPSPFPLDGRTMPLYRLGGVILGSKSIPPLPKFTPTKEREIAEPYVCLAVQGSTPAKSWLNPNGWNILVDYLKSLGYRVLCIDKNKTETKNGYTMTKPQDAEDLTGDIPLIERANMLYHAEFFIGVSSGLSWLANAVGCPVVMISGFSQNWYEFFTPYRVRNIFVCNGCFNDVRSPIFSQKVCYRYAGMARELECQKKISPRQVINAVEKLLVDYNLSMPALQTN